MYYKTNIRPMQSRRNRCTGHVARTGKERSTQIVPMRKSGGKGNLEDLGLNGKQHSNGSYMNVTVAYTGLKWLRIETKFVLF